jgi:acyl carrier protein
MREQVKNFIYESLREVLEDSNDNELVQKLELEGDQFLVLANLDSLDMVSMLVEIESSIQDELGVQILISADRAMSERGPFATVSSLLEFTMKLIEEER